MRLTRSCIPALAVVAAAGGVDVSLMVEESSWVVVASSLGVSPDIFRVLALLLPFSLFYPDKSSVCGSDVCVLRLH